MSKNSYMSSGLYSETKFNSGVIEYRWEFENISVVFINNQFSFISHPEKGLTISEKVFSDFKFKKEDELLTFENSYMRFTNIYAMCNFDMFMGVARIFNLQISKAIHSRILTEIDFTNGKEK